MAYLVTGGTGFIGSYVVRDLLNEGKEVVCFQRSAVTPTLRGVIGEDNVDKVKIVQGDQGNTLQFFNVIREHGIELIIHTGYLLAPAVELQPWYALRVNCIGMNNVLEAVRLFGLKRVVWTSSTRTFGRITEFYKEPMGDDDAILNPDNFYGATKTLNEFMARHYFDKFGTDSIGFRIPLVVGYGKWGGGAGALPEFLREAALNRPVTVGYSDRTNCFMDVEDVSGLIVKACDVPTTKTRVFNVMEGEYSNRQLVETVRKINPQAQVTLLDGEGGVLPFKQMASPDTTGVRTELGWQPKYSLAEAIRKVMNRYRQQEGLPLL